MLPCPSPAPNTLAALIDSIDFQVSPRHTQKKPNPRVKSVKSISETDSISSARSAEFPKEKSKVWSGEEMELFKLLLKRFGTDFSILSNFFPRKTKNQLKNRYKQLMNLEKKEMKEEVGKLKAMALMFEEKPEMEDEGYRKKSGEDMLEQKG